MVRDRHDPWNHNTHYYDIVLSAVPPAAQTALDVGTGDGLLAARLRSEIPEVTGIDSDAEVIGHARNDPAEVNWMIGDVMTTLLPQGHYDLVATVATVHHLPDLAGGLARLADLTAPGGALVVIGCARSSSLSDYALDVIGAVQHQFYSRTRGYWQHSAPVVVEFPHTYDQVRQIAVSTLPGMQWRRLPLWRYAITWTKPR